jgi:predicted PurR-regulated permease PerM
MALIDPVAASRASASAAQGEEFVDLAAATMRNVSRGIIGIAILQALLAGIGLLFTGVPAAGLFSVLVLVPTAIMNLSRFMPMLPAPHLASYCRGV